MNEVESYKVTRTTSDGTIDVTSKYNITTAPGELKVNKRSVILHPETVIRYMMEQP